MSGQFPCPRTQYCRCCESYTGGQILVCKESGQGSGKEFRLNVPRGETFCKVQLDGCLEQEGHAKCDFMIFNRSRDIQVFVELKGKRLSDAQKQIETSMKRHAFFERLNTRGKLKAWIVCSKVPKVVGSQKIKKYFEKEWGVECNIHTKSVSLSYADHELRVCK